MEAMEAILTRRSVRQYGKEEVPADAVGKIIEAGMCAPSAGGQRPWHFVVINDRVVLNEVVKFHPYAGMIKSAPVAIAVCADLDAEKFKGFWVQDCAAAVQNMLLAAHALGYGGVWLGIHPLEDRVAGVKKLLGLPPNIEPLAIVPFGVPADGGKTRPGRFDADRVHYNLW